MHPLCAEGSADTPSLFWSAQPTSSAYGRAPYASHAGLNSLPTHFTLRLLSPPLRRGCHPCRAFALVFSSTNSFVLFYKLLPEVGRHLAAPLPFASQYMPFPPGLLLNRFPSCIVLLYSRAASIRSRRWSCRGDIPALQRYFCPQRQAPAGSSGQDCVRTIRLSNAALFASWDEVALAREAAASQPPR